MVTVKINPIIPKDIFTDPEATSSEIATFLVWLNEIKGHPYIHPRLLSFPNATQKANWQTSLPDIDMRDTYFYLWSTAKKHQATWLAMFSTPIKTWVADPIWDEQFWHIWGIALIASSNSKGKHLVIWDCDPRDPGQKRPHQFLLPAQNHFLKLARKKTLVLSLWYHIDRAKSVQNKCLQFTMEWLHQTAQLGDYPLQENDIRLKNCIQIKKK